MIRNVMAGSLVALTAMVVAPHGLGQTPGAAGSNGDAALPEANRPAATRAVDHGGSTTRIAFWYRKREPERSFQYQVYDVRRGQSTRAVEEWLAVMRTRYPAYVAEFIDADSAEATVAAIAREREIVRVRQSRVDKIDGESLGRYLSRPLASWEPRRTSPEVRQRKLPTLGRRSTAGGMSSVPLFMIPNPILR